MSTNGDVPKRRKAAAKVATVFSGDLSFATTGELLDELKTRFPAIVMACVGPPDDGDQTAVQILTAGPTVQFPGLISVLQNVTQIKFAAMFATMKQIEGDAK